MLRFKDVRFRLGEPLPEGKRGFRGQSSKMTRDLSRTVYRLVQWMETDSDSSHSRLMKILRKVTDEMFHVITQEVEWTSPF